MKKYLWILLLTLITIGVVIYFYNSKQDTEYSTQKSGTSTSSVNTTDSTDNITYTIATKTPTEKEISNFSTIIKNTKDLNRQGNITITCSLLNNTIVKSGETFSFCDTVGPSTVERGYKTANVIIQGTETKGLGGGNCQVSSTLYNAVLAVPNEPKGLKFVLEVY